MVSKLNYINTDISLDDAARFAQSVLSRDSQSSHANGTQVVRHEHFHWGSGMSYFPQPVYCGPSASSSREEKKNDNSWVAIPAALLALGTVYFIGQNHAEWSQAKGAMSKLQEKHRIVRGEIAHAHPALKTTVNNVFQKQMTMIDQIRSNAARGLFYKVVLFASLTATGIGAIANTALLTYGAVSSTATAAVMLYRAGFSSVDNTLKEEAKELQVAVNRASAVLDQVSR